MGGGAFAQAAAADEPTLSTPRMSSSDYVKLKEIYTARLQAYFLDCAVSSLLEAPEKPDHGDIDFIIATQQHVDYLHLARQVGARGVICRSSNDGKVQSGSLAVPIDGKESEKAAVTYTPMDKVQPSDDSTTAVYAQIDVAIIPPELFRWHMFYASYGDMASLLGKFVHYFGFTVTDKGLLLRLQELDEAKATGYIQNINDSSGKLFLSRDPDLVMKFLGLSPEKFHRGFTTMNEFYEWLGECRLLSPDTVKHRRNNSHERNREKNRSVYAKFLEEWLPAHFGIDPQEDEAPESPKKDVSEKRLQLRNEAIRLFDKQKEFETMHSALTLYISNQTAAHLIKPFVTQHSGLKDKKVTEVVRALRRWVVFSNENGEPTVAQSPHSDEESQLHLWLADDGKTLRDVDGTSEWVKQHWQELKGLERQNLKDRRELPPS